MRRARRAGMRCRTRTMSSSEAIGRSYQALGDHDHARPMLERALETRAQVIGRDHEDTLRSMNRLALLYDLGIVVMQGYGSTECGIVTATDERRHPTGRVGRVHPPVEV